MLSKQDMSKRTQMGFFALENLILQDHLLRQIDQFVDFSFIYNLVKDKYDKLIMDAGYKTPTIVQLLLEPVFPYKRPMTKEGYFKKYEYYDCYICPNNKIISYSTTNRKS